MRGNAVVYASNTASGISEHCDRLVSVHCYNGPVPLNRCNSPVSTHQRHDLALEDDEEEKKEEESEHFISSGFLYHMNSSPIMMVSRFANNLKQLLYMVSTMSIRTTL